PRQVRRRGAAHGAGALRGELRQTPRDEPRVISVQPVARFIQRDRLRETPEGWGVLGVVAVLNPALEIAPGNFRAGRAEGYARERRGGERRGAKRAAVRPQASAAAVSAGEISGHALRFSGFR